MNSAILQRAVEDALFVPAHRAEAALQMRAILRDGVERARRTPSATTPPDGWFSFGSFVAYPDMPLERSAVTGDDGLPLWERPVLPNSGAGEERDTDIFGGVASD